MIKAFAASKKGGLLESYEYEPGTLASDEIEIDVKYCGICHSDLSAIDDEWGMSSYPMVPGHEVVGVVSKVGENVHILEVGQNVGLGWHSRYCTECEHCQSGNHNFCQSATSTIFGHYGGFANKVRAAAHAVIPIPEGIRMASAGPLFCGGITVFNPLIQFGIKPTDKVAVIGIGGLGHMALKFLRAWGCEVTAFTSTLAKRTEALELGAHDTLCSKELSDIQGAAGRFDFLLSTVNVSLDWNLYLSTLKPRGRFHFVGAVLKPLDIGVFNLMMSQLTVSSSPVGSPQIMKQMLDFANRHKIEPMVEIFPISKINDAIQHVRDGKARYRVVLEM